MIALHEMIFYAICNWGEKTPRSIFNVPEDKKWPIMKDSNILIRDEGINTYNSENIKKSL
ncbi:MAG TPA: hypothetical protein PLL26_02325 [Candidatus Dojkabacteria bacterium]|nr:hypothetical protein [Candidatus Dojkabacteria bacterium]